MNPRLLTFLALLALFTALPAGKVRGMGWAWAPAPLTFRMELKDCHLLAIARLERSQKRGDSEFAVLELLRMAPAAGSRCPDRLTVEQEVSGAEARPTYLLFAEVVKGRLDVYQGLPFTCAVVSYIRGLLELEGQPDWEVLRYCATHLEDADPAVANDCAAEFAQGSDLDILVAGRRLDPAPLRRWLADKRTRPERLGLYALLLACCGQEADADLLRQTLDRLVRQEKPPYLDRLLAAYTLLRPREGWNYVRQLAAKKDRPFILRYACLRAARFLQETNPGLLTGQDIRGLVEAELDQPDLADLAVVQLARWHAWELTPRVLALADRPGFDLPIIKRSVLLYALKCPDPTAARFVADLQAKDPERVQDAKELKASGLLE